MGTTRQRLARHFPEFALEVCTPRLVLRYPDDDDVLDAAELAALGVHPAERMPFLIPWTGVEPPHQERNSLQHYWQQRTTLHTASWSLPLVVVVDGQVAGVQAITCKGAWEPARIVETGSWLGQGFQGRGLGKEMRAAVLQLAFDGFGVRRSCTAAWVDNPSSLGVTRALGYRPNGTVVLDRRGEAVVQEQFFHDAESWAPFRRDDIDVVGAAEVAALFGTAKPPV